MSGKVKVKLVGRSGQVLQVPADQVGEWGVAFHVDEDAPWVAVLKVADERVAQGAAEAVLRAVRGLGYRGAQVLVVPTSQGGPESTVAIPLGQGGNDA